MATTSSTTSRVPETKVLAGLLGTTGGAVIGKLILWLIGIWVYKVAFDAPHADEAVAAVPQPLGDTVWLLITLLVGGTAAYLAPHTLRPDLQTPPDPQVVNQPEKPAEYSSMAKPLVVDPPKVTVAGAAKAAPQLPPAPGT